MHDGQGELVLASREAGCQIIAEDVWKTIALVDPASSSGCIYCMLMFIKHGPIRDHDPALLALNAPVYGALLAEVG